MRGLLALLLLLLPAGTLAAQGLDVTFNAGLVANQVLAVAQQPDGKIIVAGDPGLIGGEPYGGIARLNANGTLDPTFSARTNGQVYAVAVQGDGKILLGGGFTSVNDSPESETTGVNNIARLNADGSLDTSFNSSGGTGLGGMNDWVFCILPQPDGSMVVGGLFTSVNGSAMSPTTGINRITRLNSDGSVDASFNRSGGVGLGGANDIVRCVARQPDGKLVIGGDFGVVNGHALGVNFVARLNANGSLDTSFNSAGDISTNGANSVVYACPVQPDGKILLAGHFTSVNDSPLSAATGLNYIARLNSDGTVDTTFNRNGGTGLGGTNESVRTLALLANGRIVLGGAFSRVNGSTINTAAGWNHLARLNADGTLDASFNSGGGTPLAGADDWVLALMPQADGGLIMGGNFNQVNGSTRRRVARLVNDPGTQQLTMEGPGQLRWTRTGAVPEVFDVTFEISANGGFSYAPLPGTTTRIGTSASWQYTGAPLPPSGKIRVRGRTQSGLQLGSSGLVESVTDYTLPSPTRLIRPGDFATGLRGWWKLEEATGTSRADSSSNGNHLAPVNGPAHGAENYWSATGGSVQLSEPADQELQISHALQTGLEFSGAGAQFTLAAWVKAASFATSWPAVIYKQDASGHTGYGLALTNAGGLRLNINDQNYYDTTTTPIAVGRWHHVAVSFDAATNRAIYFVDGNVIGVRDDVTADPLACTKPFRIGGEDNTVHYFNGRIHDAAVWARVLSPLEIKSLASGIDVSSAYRPGNVSVAPTAWWKMNEVSSGSAAVLRQDSIGSFHWTDMTTATSGGGYLDGAAAEFRRANNEHLFSGDSSVFDFSGGVWSVSAWVMPYDLANRQLLFEQLSGGNDFMAAYVEPNGSLVMRVDRSGATVVLVESAAGLVKPGTWHHCVFTEDGNAWKIHLDGREVTATGGSNADRAANYSGGIQIAQSGVLGGGAKFDGRLADFAVWRGHSLGNADIKALATALQVQKEGITSYWPLDETTGTRNDASGTNHLTPVNGPASAPGMVGTAASFQRSSAQRLEISHAAQAGLDAPSSISLLYWGRLSSSGLQSVLGKWSANQGYMAFFTEANLPVMDVDATVWAQGNTAPANGGFHYGSQVFDGYQGNIYLNGRLDRAYAPTTTYAAASNTAPFSIGSASGANYPFDGLIDEVVVARRWFRQEEIKALYNRGLNGLAAVPMPEITIEQPAMVALVSGVSQTVFGSGLVGSSSQPKTFTIRNAGNSELMVSSVSVSGANAADFVVDTTGTAPSIAAGATTTFTVTFTPGAATARTATLRIGCNDEDEPLFDVLLTGAGMTALDVVQRHYLKAGYPTSEDIFGQAVAISGDTAVVGAKWEEGNSTGVNSATESTQGAFRSGAAYVFVRDAAGQWTRQAYLKASNTQSYDYFGSSVAIHGDVIVVGAPGEDGGSGGVNGNQASEAFAQIGTSAGAAYVFSRQGTTWSQQAYLKAPVPVAQGNFGGSVAVNGETVMVGASNQHAAFVFTRSGGFWSHQQTLTGSNTELGDYFGHAMALSGNTAAISAPWEDATGNAGFDCGAVYVFTRPAAGAAWSQQAYLNASNPGQRDYFGKSLALDGNTLAVGAEEEDSDGTGVNSATQNSNVAAEAGAVYVFTRTGSAWSQQAYVKTGNTGAGDLFGTSVALSGDSLLVGAPKEDSSATWVNGHAANDNAPDAGAAYLFKRVGTTWTQHAYIKASNTDAGDQFGNAVALSGDTALIGAEIEDGASGGINGNQMSNAQGDAGAVYLFTGLGPLAPEIRVEQPAGAPLTDSSSTVALGTAEIGSGGTSRVFTVRNVNGGDLTGLAVSVVGAHAGDFTVDAGGMSTTLAPGAATTFAVTFAPTAIAERTALLQIASSDSDENPFDVSLTGTGTGTQSFTFASGADVAVTTNGFTATGSTINLSLGFSPATFGVLTVVNNTSGSPIGGTFTNLVQGQTLTLTYGGTAYYFMADYFGGDGNDLVLRRRDPGVLDLSFNDVGRIATAFGSGHEQANDVVVQPDGKILAVGTAHDGSNDAFALARYTADGTLDASFGSGGKVMTALGNQGSEAHAVALQPDGRIVVAGFTMNDGVRKIALVRYLANGALDSTFGAGGKVTTLIGSINAEGRDVVLLANGKILVGGDYWAGADTDFALVRYNANGTLDTTFDTDGILTTANAGKHDEATSLALASDGKIVLGGYEQTGSSYLLKVARYTAAGALDVSFSSDGLLTTELNVSGFGRDVAVQPDGKIFLCGTAGGDAVVARCNLDGTLDTSFDGDGIASFAYGSFGDDAWSILLQPDGKILAGGLTEDGTAEDMLLLRLNTNGTLDTSFALTGKVAVSFGLTCHDQVYGMALQPDGRIVLAGVTMPQGGNKDFALARLLGETERQASFASADTVPLAGENFSGSGQTVNITLGFAPQVGTELTLVNNTGLLPIGAEFTNLAHGATLPLTFNSVTYNFVASYIGGTGNDLTLLLPGPGALDYSFNGRGKVETVIGGSLDYANFVVAQPDGKALVAGYCFNGVDNDFAITRYNADGSLDTSFGGTGKVVTAIGGGNDEALSIAVQKDGRIVVAGHTMTGANRDFAVVRYLANGGLDPAFNSTGKVTLPIGSAEDLCNSVVVQPDGKIILGGFAFVGGNADFALARLNTNGTLDTTFNTTGTVTAPVSGSHDVIRTVALQPDGKIVVSGYATPGAQDFAVARFLATGALDTSFNTTGKVMTSFGAGNDVGQNVVVLPDGGILVGGYASIGGNNDLALARYTSAGVLDAAFGIGGLVTTAIGGGHDVGSMAVQADGRIVMAGFGWNGTNYDLVVARHLPNGSLDTGFRGTGKAMFPVGDGDDLMQSLAFQPDGKILIAGGPQIGGVHRFGLVRLLNDTVHPVSFTSASSAPFNAENFTLTGQTVSLTLGFMPSPGTELLLVNNTGYSPITGTFTNIAHGAIVPLTHNSVTYNFVANYTGGTGNDLTLLLPGPGGLDYSFNGSGRMTTLNGGHRTAYSTAFQSDGKIIVAGFTDNGTNIDFLVCRYTAVGALDTTFGTGGRVVTPIGSSSDYARAVVVQPDGRILVGGYYSNGSNEDFVLVRYTAAGALDPTFGTDGKVTTGVGSSSDDRVYSMALQKDGRIILAGEVTTAGNRDFGLVRFLANGALDTSFGTGGKVTTSITSDFDSGQGVAVQEDGKILVVGYGNATGDDADFLLARYTVTGTLDTSFNGTGKVITNFSGSSADAGFSVLVQKDGKIVAGGSTDNAGSKDFALVRYNANGTVDTSFGTNGRVTTALDPGTDEINQLLLQADGKIVAAGVASPGYGRVVCLARYTTGGVLDATFGTGGKVTTAIGPGNVLGAAMRGDGRILVTGYVQESSTNRDIALLRYMGGTEHSVTFASAADVPLRFDGLDGAGRMLSIALTFAPTPGTRLKVYDNTGLQPAVSEFANLTQGQMVTLTHNSVPYPFVASYFGGDGNDLVLEWAHTKLAAFGLSGSGQLGIAGTPTQATAPAQVVATAPIYSKTILGVSSGQSHSLAVCSDGSVAAWGGNENGQLGHGGTSASSTPVAVTMSGPLSGKKAVAVAAGGQHSLVLFTDGTVAAWGDGSLGQLGDGGALDHDVPVPVNTSGALAGRRVVAISAGASHSVALCGDGTVVCWGDNTNGELGDGGGTLSNVPVAVTTSGVLAGRSVIAIACGQNHTLALLADGAVAAWGSNGSQQLGNNNGTTPSNVPVFVDVAGVLNGKRVLRLAAGGHSSLVQTTDGVLAAWGLNDRGQLGVNSITTTFGTPQAVVMSGVLSGKTVTRLLAGQSHAAVLCSNGTLAAWGSGSSGQLGNNALADSRVPVAVSSAILSGADAFVSASSGALANHTLGVIGTAANSPVITVEHEGISLTHNTPAPVNFGNLVAGAYVTKSFVVRNSGIQALTGIGAQITGADAALFAIVQAPSVVLAPGEATNVIITFNPDSIGARTARLQVASNGSPASFWVNLTGSGDPELNITWLTGKEVPAQANGFDANGKDASLNLGYAPVPGTRLMMVSNTGLDFIDGIFTNPFYGVLVHGQFIDLNFNGTDYTFVVNYYGGDGNDLVLEWAGNRLLSWGLNTGGALGNGSATPTHTTLPAAVNVTTPLNGKTVLSAACGFNHSLALCSDGTVAAWGTNASGQLGNNSTTASASPVAVNQAGALSGRQVVAVAAGTSFSVALCSDGAVATWGLDTDGQLGNDAAFSNSLVPVLVDSSGALSGKVVTAIAAGGSHVLARCSDGSVVAWGSSAGLSGGGQLGNGSGNPFKSGVPVAVLATGALSGKVVTHIAAGVTHSLASSRDGTIVAWGENPYGMLGNGTNTTSAQPVLTNASGVLAGRHVMMLGAGIHHSIMLGTDGQMSGWGRNLNGQLGVNTSTSFYYNPIVVPVTDAFAGRSIEQLVPGRLHHLVCLSDGSVAGWGSGVTGQLGNGATPAAAVAPVYVSTAALTAGERFTRIYSGSSAQHNIAIVAKPLNVPGGPPVVSTSPASSVDKTTVTLNGLVNPNSLATDARFEYRLATGTYGPPTAAQALGSGSTSVTVTQNLAGLQPNTTYRYRVIAVNSGGAAEGSELTFATLPDPPSASVGAASDVGNEVATLNGIVNPNGRDTTARFQVALDPGFNTILNDYPVAIVTGAGGPVARSFTIEGGLFPGETYYYRISATNQAGSTNPETQNVVSFTTTTVGIATGPPLITNLTSTNVAATTARFQAFVNQQGSLFGDAWFEWGPVGGGYTGFTTQPFAVSGSTPQAVVEDVGSLSPATQYQYRIVARNNFNNQTIVYSSPQIFTTLPLPPEALTQSAVALSTISARLHGTVNAKNGSATVSFEWGTDGVNFPNSLTAAQSPVTGGTSTPVSVDITNLLQFTTYHYRVRAVNSGGTTVGEVRTFQPQIISGLLQQFPNAPPASNGSLTVTLVPSGLLSGWRFAGEHRWRSSGATATGLVHGSRTIEFRPVPGYLQPGSVPVSVTSGGQTEEFEYHVTPSQGTGGILVVLKPDSLAQAAQESARGQWRLLGETTWRNSLTNAPALPVGKYLVECKPVTGYATPNLVNVTVTSSATVNVTIVYSDAFSPTGTPPSVLSFATASTDATKPYGYVGQIRSNSGVGTGFAVKPRVVATAAHVVFDEASHSSVQGLQWLPQADAGTHDPLPVTPRGYYLISGYSLLRAGETPGSFSLASRQEDVAALYFTNDTAVRNGFSGFLASDLANNEFLLSSAQKMLVGYPVDDIAPLAQGRMHATPAANLSFTGLTDRVFATTGIRSTGGNSGGPLCVQHTNGSWYPAAIYLGGATQSIVRAIDSTVIQLFDTAERSAVDDQGYGGGGITHTGYSAVSAATTGALIVNITPGGTGWRPVGSTKPVTLSGNTRADMTEGIYTIEFTPVAGYQTPANQSVQVIAGTTQTYSIEYLSNQTPQESWRQTHFGSTANSGNGADSADPDGDGYNNQAEYTAGTHPTTASDHFKAQNPTRGAGTFSLSTAGKTGRTYVLERSTTLNSISWTTVTSQGPLGADASVTLTDSSSPTERAFYRIRVTGP